MKKLLLLLMFLLTVPSFASVIGGTVFDHSNAIVPSAKVVFVLSNCIGQPASLNNTGVPPLTTTFTANSSGVISGTILGNDQITCDARVNNWYTVSAYTSTGVLLYSRIYSLVNAVAFNLQTSTILVDLSKTNPSFLYNPLTTVGDIIIGGPTGTPMRLALGAAGTCLSSNGVAPVWIACGSGGVGISLVLIDTVTSVIDTISMVSGSLAIITSGTGGTSGVVLIDTVTSTNYTVAMTSGHLTVTSGGSGGSSGITLVDTITSTVYTMSIANGILTIS